MSWSDLIRRRDGRVRTTAEGVAAALAQGIVEGTNVLQIRLGDEGFGWTDPARAGADECLLECTIFEWFLRDIAMSAGFGSRTDAIRRALVGRVLIDLQRSGVSPSRLDGFDERRRARFSEYTLGLGLSVSLQPLGALAWRRISGTEEPNDRMTMLLARRASAQLAALRDVAKSYRIVDVAPSPAPAPGRR